MINEYVMLLLKIVVNLFCDSLSINNIPVYLSLTSLPGKMRCFILKIYEGIWNCRTQRYVLSDNLLLLMLHD